MKTPIAITLIIVGGLLILAPMFSAQRQMDRVAEFYKEKGNAAILPDAMQPYGSYDWVCIAAGTVLAFVGVQLAVRSRDKHSA